MLVEGNSRNVNKLYYKLFIVVLKYTPILIALCYVLNTVTAVFGIYIEPYCEVLLQRLNPEFAEQKQQKQEIDMLKTQMSEIMNGMKDLMAQLKKENTKE